jgi:mannose-6-phosphate isomerase-like protein (cupin superfamily)
MTGEGSRAGTRPVAPEAAGTAGAVISLAEAERHTGLTGHPGLTAHRFVRPPSELSRWLLVTLDVVEHGGGIDPHYHEGIVADHAYYLIAGTAIATIGDEEFEVGPDSLIVFPCQTVHGLKVTSPEGAKFLRLGASADGPASGNSVYV